MKIKNSNIAGILALLLLVACGAEDNLLESLLLPGEDAAGLERPEVVFVGPATGSTGLLSGIPDRMAQPSSSSTRARSDR